MSIKQTPRTEELCYQQCVTVRDARGKGSTQYYTVTDRQLDESELDLLDEVLSDTICINEQRALRNKIEAVRDAGYEVILK